MEQLKGGARVRGKLKEHNGVMEDTDDKSFRIFRRDGVNVFGNEKDRPSPNLPSRDGQKKLFKTKRTFNPVPLSLSKVLAIHHVTRFTLSMTYCGYPFGRDLYQCT